MEFSVARIIREVASNHRFGGVVESIVLPIGLRMVGYGEGAVNVQYFLDALRKISSEARTTVDRSVFEWAVIEHSIVCKVLRNFGA